MMIINAIQGKRLPIYGDGLQVRDWIHVSDHCEAIYRVLLNGLNGATYNLGSGSEHTNLEIAGLICDTLDTLLPNSVGESRQKLLQHIPDRPGHDRRYAMDITFVKENLGWQPAISLTDGIMQTVKWYLEHIHWIEEITKNADFSRWVQLNYDGRDERTI
jgi:dTDP-glucose 4,6-dehydratase